MSHRLPISGAYVVVIVFGECFIVFPKKTLRHESNFYPLHVSYDRKNANIIYMNPKRLLMYDVRCSCRQQAVSTVSGGDRRGGAIPKARKTHNAEGASYRLDEDLRTLGPAKVRTRRSEKSALNRPAQIVRKHLCCQQCHMHNKTNVGAL